MDAIDLIVRDHRQVDTLFEWYDSSKSDGTPEDKRSLVEAVIRELSIHASIEEEVFYPAVRKALAGGDHQVEQSLEAHREVEVELDRMPADDPAFDGKVAQLMQDVRHHVVEEESQILPSLRSSLDDATLQEIGGRLEDAKGRAPTRPPPHASSAASRVARPPAAAMDRLRDRIEGRESA